MKSVLMSIQPKWCELIASGKKTVEVRKTRPKIDVPFKCYIYCTHNGSTAKEKNRNNYTDLSGKVIGEFVCDSITEFYPTMELKQLNSLHFQMCDKSCVNMADLYNYANGKMLYGWHISDLVIYDKPKELSELFIYCGDNPKCDGCEAHYYSNTESGKEEYCCSVIDGCRPLKRPPQSWCYVDHPTEKGGER